MWKGAKISKYLNGRYWLAESGHFEMILA